MARDNVVFRTETPEFGVNYDVGWIGFNHAASWMSKGIAVVTRRRRRGEIVISHAFVVTGQDECVEAAYGKGVVESSLTEQYFDNPERYVVFRKPRGLDADIARRIVATAQSEVGTDFNNAALPNYVIQENFLGWMINRMFDDRPRDFVASLLEDPDAWICSELAAYCLDRQPEYHGRGVLKHPATAIDPQSLFEDEEIFEPLEATLEED